MEMGTFQRVVEYRLVQKMGWLGWRTTTFTIHDTQHYYFQFGEKLILKHNGKVSVRFE